MRAVATVAALLALTACRRENLVYSDLATGYFVSSRDRHARGVGLDASGALRSDGDLGESGDLNASVIEYIFAAPEGPFARYYDLVLRLAVRPPGVAVDLAALEATAKTCIAAGATPSGRDYARALGRKLAHAINNALRAGGDRFGGTAGIHWGVPVDLHTGIVLADHEQDGETEMHTTLVRHASVGLVVVHSSARLPMLVWDVSEVPGAFESGTPLDFNMVAARIIALHPADANER